jgi:hypothetical protein
MYVNYIWKEKCSNKKDKCFLFFIYFLAFHDSFELSNFLYNKICVEMLMVFIKYFIIV